MGDVPEAIGETKIGTETGRGMFEEGGTVESRGNTGDDDEDAAGEEEEEEEVENDEEEGEDVSTVFNPTATLGALDSIPSSTAFTSEATSPSDFTISFSFSFSFSFWLKSGSCEAETSLSIVAILPEKGRGSGRGREG